MSAPIKWLPSNRHGRDFVMGDLHGEVHKLNAKLAELDFDRSKDRLFSVGDLIDRGRDSLAALRLLREPWFHVVIGNHEQMMLNHLFRPEKYSYWLENGGEWHRTVDRTELVSLAKQVQGLPYVLIVGEAPDIQFKVIHAQQRVADQDLARHWNDEAETDALWTRILHKQYAYFCKHQQLESPDALPLALSELQRPDVVARYIPIMPGFALTFCGHTSIKRPGLWRSHYLLDTGCGWWPDAPLTVLDVSYGREIFRYWRNRGAGEGDVYE